MSNENDWNAEAATMADYVFTNMFESHRGAMPWKQEGITVAFGNDGYEGDEEDQRAKREVALIRGYLDEMGIPILGFGVDQEDEFSWAMLVQSGETDYINKLVWACWMPDEPVEQTVREIMAKEVTFRGVQPDIANSAILASSPKPLVEFN